MRKKQEVPLSLSQRIARFLFMVNVVFFGMFWIATFVTLGTMDFPFFGSILVIWLPFFLGHAWWYQGGRRAAAPFESLAEFSQVEREAYREGFRDAAEMLTRREAPPASLGRLAMSEDGELSDEWIDHVSGKIKRS